MAQLRQIRISEEGVVASPDKRSDRISQSDSQTATHEVSRRAVYESNNDKVMQHTLHSAQDSYWQIVEHIDQSQHVYPTIHADRMQLDAYHTKFNKAASTLRKRKTKKAAADVRACAADLMTCASRIEQRLKAVQKQVTRKPVPGAPVAQVSRDDPQYEWAFLLGSKSNAMASHSAPNLPPLDAVGTATQPQYARSVSANSSISQRQHGHPVSASATDVRSGKDAHHSNAGMSNFTPLWHAPMPQRKPAPPLPARVNAHPGNVASVLSSHNGSHSSTHAQSLSSSSTPYTRSMVSASSVSQGRDGRCTVSAATTVSSVSDGGSAAKSQHSNSSWLAQRRG